MALDKCQCGHAETEHRIGLEYIGIYKAMECLDPQCECEAFTNQTD